MAREPFETGGTRGALEALRDALGDETLFEATSEARPTSTPPPPAMEPSDAAARDGAGSARRLAGSEASAAGAEAGWHESSGAGALRPDVLGGEDMRFWTLFLLAVGVAGLGCASPLESAGGTGGDDSESADGGGSAGTTTTGSSASTSTSSTTSTSGPITTSTSTDTSTGSGGGGAMCEGGDCGSCQTCAVASACKAQYDACQANADCVALNACLNGCADAACQQACTDDHPGGAAALQAAATCVYCSACYVSCNGASVGCP